MREVVDFDGFIDTDESLLNRKPLPLKYCV